MPHERGNTSLRMTASQSVKYILVPPFYAIFFIFRNNALHPQNISFKNSSYVFCLLGEKQSSSRDGLKTCENLTSQTGL